MTVARKGTSKRVTNVKLWIFSLIVVLLPFYFWESGLPQPSHIFGAVLGIALLLRHRKWFWNRSLLVLLGLFALYASVVNIIVFLNYGDSHTLLSGLYYVYNYLFFWSTLQLVHFLGLPLVFMLLRLAFLFLLALEAVLFFLGWGRVFGESRFMGTFNDPNQLAHWTLWAVIIVLVADYTLRRNLGWLAWAALLLGLIILLASASRSGLLGFVAILLAIVLYATKGGVRLNKKVAERWLIAFVGTLIISGAVTLVALLSTTEEGTGTLGDRLTEQARFYVNRIQEGIFKGEANLEERGYDRLWKFPEYLLLGAGEGANDRWADRTSFLGEIHSTLAGVAFYYGIPGTALLLFFIVRVWIALPHIWLRFLLLAPLLYSLGTYNLRNTMFWLGMAIMWAAARELRRSVST